MFHQAERSILRIGERSAIIDEELGMFQSSPARGGKYKPTRIELAPR